jgi:hypothetical protein
MSQPGSTPRKPMGYALRFIMINALLVVSIVEARKSGGALTGKTIALYVGMGLLANVLMYFGARGRRSMAQR